MNTFQIQIRVLDFCPDPLESFRTEFLHSRSKFFLESSVIKPGFSRFSFMGDAYGPLGESITYNMSSQKVNIERENVKETIRVTSIFDFLKTNLEDRKTACPRDLPFSFNFGYVGFLGYELKGETIGTRAHDSEMYDSAFIFATRMIAFDHVERKCYLMRLLSNDEKPQQAVDWFDAVEKRLKTQLGTARAVASGQPSLPRKTMSLQNVEQWIANNARIRHEKESYIGKIHEVLQKIVNGESYEVCLTNIIEFPFEHSPFDLYCAMRELTPAPHAAYFNIFDSHLVSSSPERFLSVDAARCIEAKPIKGTRPRGRTADEDTNYVKDLRTSEKDRAENLMIVDLLRNDLGQVCTIRSVHVPMLFDVETYSHVHQLVSTIRGQIKSGVSTVDCIRAAFPGGSMTGAPKKRTMEIIDQLEQGPRGAYSGALGWFGLCGACDFSIIIRSVFIGNGLAKFGVGGAITALSDPEEEFAETIVKARGVVEAVEHLRNPATVTKKMRVADARAMVMVVGVKGSIGRLFAHKIANEAFEVIGIDIATSDTHVSLPNITLRTDDITCPDEITRAQLASASIVVFAVSQEVMIAALPNLLPYLNPDCLIVETLSIKSAFLDLLERHDVTQQVLGINPMFSGDLDIRGRPVAVVVHRGGPQVAEFVALLESWQLNAIPIDPIEHDRTMAVLQSLGHALVLSFGKTLNMSHLSASTIAVLAPPPFRVLLSLLARMTQNHPDVYWEIQADNPYARDVRQNFRTAVAELEDTIASGACAEFRSELGRMKSALIDPNPFFVETSRQIFELINVSPERKQAPRENHEMTLADFRVQIDGIDDDIVDLLGRRLEIVRQVARAKNASDTPIMQPHRVDEVKRRCKVRGHQNKLRDEFIEKLYQLIIDEACRIEYDFMGDHREPVLLSSPVLTELDGSRV